MPNTPNDSDDDRPNLDRDETVLNEPPEHIEGERDIPSVNNRRGGGPTTMQKIGGIAAACAGAVLLVLYFYIDTGKKTQRVEATQVSTEPTERSRTLYETTEHELPTRVKEEEDAKRAARAERARPIPVVPAITPETANKLTEPRSLTGAEREAARREQERLDLIERRKRAPIMAIGGQTQAGRAEAKEEKPARGGITVDQAANLAERLARLQSGVNSGDSGSAVPTRTSNGNGGANGSSGQLQQHIEPTTVTTVQAAKLPDRDLLLTQGTFIDCTLETAMDSTVPGFTRCVTTRNVYSNSGRVVLLERGTKIVGQYEGGIKQGQSRIFVLWTRAETPKGVIINLDSPATDALGRAGAEGDIDTKFWARFGGALMLSIIQDVFDYASAQAADGNVIATTGNTQDASKDAAGIALESSINIPPVLYKNQGEKVNVILARDLDFSSVYELELTAH